MTKPKKTYFGPFRPLESCLVWTPNYTRAVVAVSSQKQDAVVLSERSSWLAPSPRQLHQGGSNLQGSVAIAHVLLYVLIPNAARLAQVLYVGCGSRL